MIFSYRGLRTRVDFAFWAILTVTIFLGAVTSAETFETPPLVAEIDSLWSAGQRPAALALVEMELPLARAASDSSLVSNLLIRAGAFANFGGKNQEAEKALREGITLAKALQDSALVMTGVRWLSLAVGNQGRRNEAMDLYDELLELGIALDDRRHQGWAYVGMAWADWRSGEAEKALTQYEMAALLFPGTGDVEGELWANNGIASVNKDLGRFGQAAAGYLSTIEVARSHNQPLPEAMALNNLGTLEYSLGRADVALAHFQRASELQSQRGYPRAQIAPLYNIALCLNNLGQVQAARGVLDEALVICQENGFRDLRSRTLVKIAAMERRHHNLHQAAKLIQEAMDDPETMLIKDVIGAKIELGEAYRLQGDLTAATGQFAQADSLLGDKDFLWVRMRLMGNQARAYRGQGELQRALDQFQALAEFADEKGFPDFRLTALIHSAETSAQMGRSGAARDLYLEAARTWEEDRRLLLSPEWRERRGASGRDIFTDLAELILQTGDVATPFYHLQSYKARTLLERMLGPGEAFVSNLSQSATNTASLAAVQSEILAADELLLDFTLGPRVSLLYAVTADTVVVRQLSPAGEIEDRARAYFDLLKSPDAGSPAALAMVGADLGEILLADLPRSCRDKKRILVAPDGALNLLPFAEMDLQDWSPVWTRIPSISVLQKLRLEQRAADNEDPWRTLAVASQWNRDGEPLPGTLQEVHRLAKGIRGVQVRVLDDHDTEIPALVGYDILHLAAHASNNDQSPWQSAIHFLPDAQSGNLRAADILNLELDAGLTVLSSCNSGTGKILNGEGVLGLSSAFLGAGVPAVLASLWAVDDGATAGFMGCFYGFLADGQDCARALSNAQHKMRGHPSTQHPYYWAGFVLIGDGSMKPQLEMRRDPLLVAATGLLGLTLVGTWFFWWRSRFKSDR